MFGNTFSGKNVLISGHTGFKGSWLTLWLLKLGANVTGISSDIPTQPSLFEVLQIENKINHHIFDIRDKAALEAVVQKIQPDFIFHLAAQAIVSTSYIEPLETISTNVLGTATLLDVIRELDIETKTVIITSDKCYENVEWVWGYRETDVLGGKDVYSASKGAAEIIFHSYYQSFFKNSRNIKIASARAGNVLGGGDWSRDRIVVDCMINWSQKKSVKLRSPAATRPWQHVLEPLSGYLSLAQNLINSQNVQGESYNFGPRSEQNRTVLELLTGLKKRWSFDETFKAFEITDNITFKEAGLLKLNCDKALADLGWRSNLDYEDCIAMVGDWYYSYYNDNENMYEFTLSQINSFEETAKINSITWAKNDFM